MKMMDKIPKPIRQPVAVIAATGLDTTVLLCQEYTGSRGLEKREPGPAHPWRRAGRTGYSSRKRTGLRASEDEP